MDWDLISFITSSKLRFKILTILLNSNYTPSELAHTLSEARSHVSSTLKMLESQGLVKCLTPDRRRNKFFQITKKGERILKQINILTKKG